MESNGSGENTLPGFAWSMAKKKEPILNDSYRVTCCTWDATNFLLSLGKTRTHSFEFSSQQKKSKGVVNSDYLVSQETSLRSLLSSLNGIRLGIFLSLETESCQLLVDYFKIEELPVVMFHLDQNTRRRLHFNIQQYQSEVKFHLLWMKRCRDIDLNLWTPAVSIEESSQLRLISSLKWAYMIFKP